MLLYFRMSDLERVFNKYSANGKYLEKDEFVHIARRVNPGMEKGLYKAFYFLFCEENPYMFFNSFKKWWDIKHVYLLDGGDKLLTAYQMYKAYKTGNGINIDDFKNLIEDLDILQDPKEFQFLDMDSNGVLSFAEFVNWLKWFS